MAIAYDAVSEGNRDASAGVNTDFSHSCTGSDRFLVVHVATYKSGSGDIVTGVTYNGVSMTLLNQETAQTEVETYMFYLANPASGSNTVSIKHPSNNYIWGIAGSYTGVDQTTPIDSSASGTTSGSTSITSTTTVVASNCWLIGGFENTNNMTTAGAGTTRRLLTSHSLPWTSYGDSNGTVGTGAQSLIMNCASGGNRTWHTASIAEAAGGTDYPLTAALGTFILTGIATALSLGMNMVASVGTFILTGIDNAFTTGKGFVADTGTFILTGTTTAFSTAVTMVASAGTFVLTGIDAILDATARLVASAGTFVLTGEDAILRPSNIVKNVSKFVTSVRNISKS